MLPYRPLLLSWFFLFFTTLSIVPAAAFPVTLTDALKHQVTIPQLPRRIVSLAPNVTEILFAIGAGKRVVADTTYCHYPAAATTLPKIGGYLDPNVEKVAAMTPDLVIGSRGNPLDLLTRIKSLGLPVLTVDETTLDEVLRDIRLIGRAVGAEDAANKLDARLKHRQQAIMTKTHGLSETGKPRVLFLFALDGGLFSAGPGSFVDELIRLGGGRNIAVATNTAWPELSMEAVIAADPQVILLLANHGTNNSLTAKTALAKLRAQSGWRTVTAVKTGRVVVMDDDAMTLPAPRLLDGLEATARALHPELFPKKAW